MEWVALAVSEIRTRKSNGRVRGGELRRRQNDYGFEKIKTGGNGRAPAFKNCVGNVSRNERTKRRNERNADAEILKLRVVQIEMMHFLHEAKEPLVDSLAHGAGAGICAGDDPDDRIARDRPKNFADAGAHLIGPPVSRRHRDGNKRHRRRVGLATISAMPTPMHVAILAGIQNSQRQCNGGI